MDLFDNISLLWSGYMISRQRVGCISARVSSSGVMPGLLFSPGGACCVVLLLVGPGRAGGRQGGWRVRLVKVECMRSKYVTFVS